MHCHKCYSVAMETGRYHHIFDLSECDVESIADTTHIGTFIAEMAEAIGMTILHGPVVINGIEENPGVTGFAIVDFSHISVHTFTADRSEALIDIFSCKPYAKEKALEVCLAYFGTPDTAVRHKEVFWGASEV